MADDPDRRYCRSRPEALALTITKRTLTGHELSKTLGSEGAEA
jgi:hypothetical protein